MCTVCPYDVSEKLRVFMVDALTWAALMYFIGNNNTTLCLQKKGLFRKELP